MSEATGGRGPIVVGVDGSEDGEAALDWAIAEAALRGVTLVVVHAWRFGTSPSDPTAGEAVREIGRAAQHLLDHAVARGREAGVDTVGRLLFAAPAHALVEESDGAALLAVGSRGRGRIAGTLLGSVSTACVRHAVCPVVVVPYDGARDDAPHGAG